MSKKTLTVTIDLEGKAEISADGYKGKGCEAASKFLEEALGMETGKRTKKPEWFQQETSAVKQRT